MGWINLIALRATYTPAMQTAFAPMGTTNIPTIKVTAGCLSAWFFITTARRGVNAAAIITAVAAIDVKPNTTSI